MERNVNFYKVALICSLSIFIIGLFWPGDQSRAAEGAKEIDIALTPSNQLFHLTNMKPGDRAKRTLTVSNKTQKDFKYTAKAHRQSGSAKLYNQFLLKVQNENETLYNGKLKNFDGLKPRYLSYNQKENLQFKIIFPSKSGNEFQGLRTKIVLTFFASDEANGQESGTNPPSTGTMPTGGGSPSGGMSSLNATWPQTGETSPLSFYMVGSFLILIGSVVFAWQRWPLKQ